MYAYCISSPIDIVLYGYPHNYNHLNPFFEAIMNILEVSVNYEKLESFFYDLEPDNGELWVFGNPSNGYLK